MPRTYAKEENRGMYYWPPLCPKNISACSSHSTGNGFINVTIVSPAGCRPSRIISTMSGASSVSRRMRLT